MKNSFFCFIHPKILIYSFLFLILLIGGCNPKKAGDVIIYPAPEGEVLNTNYQLNVNGQNIPVYNAKIGMENKVEREKAMDDAENSHLFHDIAGFAYFDIKKDPVKIAVTIDKKIETAKILPSSFGIVPKIKGNSLWFEIDKPQHLTVEINGEHIRSLHILVNPEEKNIPNLDDPDVIYFGPGIHDIYESIEVKDNQTVYVAGGAIVRCHNVKDIDDQEAKKKANRQSFILSGKNVTFRGRGIIDQENVHRMQPRQMVSVTGEDIRMEGVILRNSSLWTVSLRGADRVEIDNIKLLGHRANSDGIDICDSWDILVENCFLRTLDDLVVVKTFRRENGSGNILVRKCVLWNEVAHALSIGAEIKQQVDGVVFTDCDIIGDHCREWSLRVYQSDKGIVRNITFDNIRIEEAVQFASLWINESRWSTDAERGHIENITFKNITVNSPVPLEKKIEFLGFDEEHAIKNVHIENVTIQGEKVTYQDIVQNEYVYNVTVE